MEARLSAVQQRLLWVLVASIVMCVLVRPQFENGRYRAALSELSRFSASFDKAAAERSLSDQAKAATQLRGEAVSELVARARAGKLKFVNSAAVDPLTSVSLNTLNQLFEQGGAAGSVAVGVPDLSSLGESLAWRLSRAQRSGTQSITSIQLLRADVSEVDLFLESEVSGLRVASLDARAKMEDARRKMLAAERTVARRSHRSPHVRAEAAQKLSEAQRLFERATRDHEQAQARYEQEATRAQRQHTVSLSPEIPRLALARVTLASGQEQLRFDVPVKLVEQRASVAPLNGVHFAALHQAGLWDELVRLSPEQAKQSIEERLSWHFRTATVLGVPLRAGYLLQLSALIAPFMLLLLVRRMQHAEAGYNPLTTQVPSSLRRVGFNSRIAEFMAVVGLPLLSVLSAALSLVLVGQIPIVPALSAAACMSLGGTAFLKLRELREFSSSIVRSHSIPPPLNAPQLEATLP